MGVADTAGRMLLVATLLMLAPPPVPPLEAPGNAEPLQRRNRAIAAGLYVGSAAFLGATIAMRLQASRILGHPRECDFIECIAVGIGDALDAVTWQGASYLSAIPSIGLGMAGSYMLGRTRPQPAHPSQVRGAGIGLLVAGCLTWAAPRLALAHPKAFADASSRQFVQTLDATFYVGYAATMVGGSLITFTEGTAERAQVSASLGPQGVVVHGRF